MMESFMEQLKMLSKSQKDYDEKLAQFLAFGHLFGQNVGLTLSQSFCIGGKPALTADGIWGRVIESGNLRFKWTHLANDKVSLYALRKDMSDDEFKCDIEYTLTVQEAKSAGYARGMGWSKFPQQMLMARCKTFVARALFSEVVGGLYAVEELDSNDHQQYQALHEQPQRNSSPPPPIPPQKKTELTPPPFNPSQPSNLPKPFNPPQPSNPPRPPKRFSRTAAQNVDQLLSMLVNQGLNPVDAGNAVVTLNGLFKTLIREPEEKIKFARLCLESNQHFKLALQLGAFACILDEADKWPKLTNANEELAQSIADQFNYIDDPWAYFGKIMDDVGNEEEDMHTITKAS